MNKGCRLIFFSFLSSLLLTFQLRAQTDGVCQRAQMLRSMFEKFHYSPVALDDRYSQGTFEDVLEVLDPMGLVFLASDIQELEQYQDQLDDEIQSGACNFFDDLISVFRSRLIRSGAVVDSLFTAGIDWDTKDTMYFGGRGDDRRTVYATSEKQLISRWRKRLKYLWLDEYYYVQKDSSSEFEGDKEMVQQLDFESRLQALDVISDWLQDGEDDYEEGIAETYLNAMAHQYDPHSSYMSPFGKQELESYLTPEMLSFGMEVAEDEWGRISVHHLVPGGAAWRSNLINTGDVLLSAEWDDGTEDDFTIMDVSEVREALGHPERFGMHLTLEKPTGKKVDVFLVKELIDVEDNAIQSFVLEGEQKLGYIYLPSFYQNFSGYGMLGCANDVGKEIIKLKREGIEGLILDLRYNGGGSLKEAVELSGIFIDAGPQCIVAEQGTKPMSLKDMNRGTLFSGPLVVMINGSSASASEVVAAGLQDFNRAVILGTRSYGKASGQVILPMDTAYRFDYLDTTDAFSELGYVKVTTHRLYRITTSSLQSKGVEPDVLLPNIYAGLEPLESDEKNCLPLDSIKKKMYYTPMEALPVTELQSASQKRISSDDEFSNVRDLNRDLRDWYDVERVLALEREPFLEFKHKRDELWERAHALEFSSSEVFEVKMNSFDQDLMDMDDLKRERNIELMGRLAKDKGVEEAYFVLLDLIRFDNQ